jgi:hypothetical protein
MELCLGQPMRCFEEITTASEHKASSRYELECGLQGQMISETLGATQLADARTPSLRNRGRSNLT